MNLRRSTWCERLGRGADERPRRLGQSGDGGSWCAVHGRGALVTRGRVEPTSAAEQLYDDLRNSSVCGRELAARPDSAKRSFTAPRGAEATASGSDATVPAIFRGRQRRARAVQHVYPRRPRCRQIDGTVRPPKVWMAKSSYGGGKLTPPSIPGLGLRGGARSAPPRWCRFGTTGGLSRGCRIDTPVADASTRHRGAAVPGRPTVVEIPHRRRTLMDFWCG